MKYRADGLDPVLYCRKAVPELPLLMKEYFECISVTEMLLKPCSQCLMYSRGSVNA